jgi:DNA polymerase IV
LLADWLTEQPRAAVRLLGVGVSDLRSPLQADLFAAEQPAAAKRLDVAVDGIRDRFGNSSLTRASLLPKPGT